MRAFVCPSACLSIGMHISETTLPNFAKFLEHIACCHGLVHSMILFFSNEQKGQ